MLSSVQVILQGTSNYVALDNICFEPVALCGPDGFTAPADLCIDAGVQTGLGGGTPTGGVYSGTGVTDDGNGMTYSFDPATAGVGTHTITYTQATCGTNESDNIEVFALPTVMFTALADLCVNTGVQSSQGGGLPTGGVYSGPGVTDDGNGMTYTFNPSSGGGAGVGTHTITYTFTDANGCTGSASDDVQVFSIPQFDITLPQTFCADDGVETVGPIVFPTYATGVYSGTGVTDNGNGSTFQFDVLAVGVGVHPVTYTATNVNGCSNEININMTVLALPTVAFTAPADLCVDTDVQTGLGGGTPPQGTVTGDMGVYSGSGVTDDGNGMTYSFDPAVAGVGVHTLTYTYTDENGCTNSASDEIEVFALPNVTFTALADLCVNAGVQSSQGGGLPTGGVYSGPGVTDDGNGMTYSFDPAMAGIGTHTITYNFTDASGCTGSATDDVQVFALPPNPDFSFPFEVCEDDGISTQGPLCIPCAGAVYSGTGVTDSGNGTEFLFDPSVAGVGVTPITVTLTSANGCVREIIVNATVNALPTVGYTAPADLCLNDGVQTGLGGGTPPQGTITGDQGVYSGPGVTDDGNGMTYNFDPALAGVGTHTLTYTYTDENGCTNSATDMVQVFALPNVTFTALADLCINAGIQVSLTGGSPMPASGTLGIYSGLGVTNNGDGSYDFDPGATFPSVHTITYTFTDANGCRGSASDNVVVFNRPRVRFTAPDDLCVDAPAQTALGGGTPTGGVYSGPGVTDDSNGMTFSFDPSAAGVGTHTITYTFTDTNGCTDSASDNIEAFDCGFNIADPCNCLDNATVFDVDAGTGGDDGQFSEVVSIMAMGAGGLPSGQIWTVTAATGAFDAFNVPSPGMQSAAAPVATDGSVTLVYNAGDMSYEIPFVHIDDIGYSMTIEGPFGVGSAANSTLTISNRCAYPDPVFDPALPSTINDDDPAINLGGTDTNGSGADMVTFTIDGNAATSFDPGALGGGIYTVVMSFDGADDGNAGVSPDGGTTAASPGCVQTVQQQVEVIVCDPPVAMCMNATVQLDAAGNGSITTADIDNGSTADCGLQSLTLDIMDFSCADLGPNTVTLTVTDDRDDTDACMATVTVVDMLAPVPPAAPAGVDVQCAADVPAPATLTAQDNCDGPVRVNPSIVITPGLCANQFTEVRTWTFVDASGNESSVSQTINVADTTPPDTPTAPADVDVQCGADIPDAVDLTAIDNCDGDITVSPSADITPGSCPNEFTMVRTWTFIDDCGNESSVSQTINVADNTPPDTPTAPADLNVQCGADIPDPVDLTAIDNCDGDITVAPSVDITPGSCPNEFTMARTWTFIDDCGNESSVSQTINVSDTTPPVPPADPADMRLQCAANLQDPVDLTAVDNCDGDITVSPSVVITPGSCPNEFTVVRTWTFTDQCGNTSSVDQEIIISDDTPPVAPAAPADLDVQCGADVPAPADLIAVDNCDGDVTGIALDDITPGSCPNEFTVVRTWTFTDACGNSSDVSQTINVADTTPPVPPADPADMRLQCAANLQDPVALTAVDNCDGDITVMPTEVITPGSCPNKFTVVRTWTFTDQCGNTSSVDQEIVVSDDFAPVPPAPPADVMVQCAADIPPPVDLTAVDNCDGDITVSPSAVITPGNCANQLTMVRTWTFIDVCGNESSVSQTINVADTTPPDTPAPPADVAVQCADDVPPPVDLTAQDNCDGPITVSPSAMITPGSCDNQFTMVRTWTFTDQCGNTSSVSQTIEVDDTTPPVMTCPADLTIECDESTDPANTGMASALDNCDGDTDVTFSDVVVVGACPQESVITRTWSSTDMCGNTNTCDQIITVVDTQAPDPVCNTIRIFLSAEGMYTLTQADIDAIAAGSSDNCDDDFTYMVDQTMFNCDDIDLAIGAIGGAEIELTVMDCVGNTDACTAIVEIDDSAVPFDFGCIGDLNVTLQDGCSATITPDMVVRGFDDCIDSYEIMIDGQDTDVVTGCGDHTYSITLIEDGEAVYNCWGSLFTEDKTAPEIDCQDERAGTGTAFVPMTMQTYDGSLDGADPTLVLNDYSCFTDALAPAPGDRPYDLITFTPTVSDVYSIGIAADFDSYIALFRGTFSPDHPCSNILGSQDDNYVGDRRIRQTTNIFGLLQSDAIKRIALPLVAGQSYTILVTNAFDITPDFGDYELTIASDNGNSVTSAFFGAAETMTVEKELLCTDVEYIQFQNVESWIVDADGNLKFGETRDVFFNRSTAALNAFLEKLGYINVPLATDNCGDMVISVADHLNTNGDCGEITITRTFTVTDRYNNCEGSFGSAQTASCEVTIFFRRPNVGDIILPPFTAPIECDEAFATDGDIGGPDDNPAASVTGAPFIEAAFAYVDLAQTACNVAANYSDEPRINSCEGTYQFRREWNIIDWCDAGNNFEWDQFVKVGDFTGPDFTLPGFQITADNNDNGLREIAISTSPFDCNAYVRIPELNIIDNCSPNGTGGAYKITAEGGTVIATGTAGDSRTTSAPIGNHELEICATDGCGNEKCETFDLIVRDEIEPYASCDDQLNISIGGGDITNGLFGIHRVFADAVGEGSSDNCSEVELYIRREITDPASYACLDQFDYDGDGRIIRDEVNTDPDNFSSPGGWFTPWLEYADFTCCDVAQSILVEVMVVDESGNSNVCWMYVEPEDKIRPYCYAPGPQTLTCADLPLTFPGDLVATYNEDRAGTVSMLNALFGAPMGTDNCRVDTIVENRPSVNLNDCGWGTITRRFEVWSLRPEGDASDGITRDEVLYSTNSCSQLIRITEIHDYTIDFPEDAAADCADPCVPDIDFETPGCDVLTINRGEPQRFEGLGDECYKLEITYDVINWCIWDGVYAGTQIPRDPEACCDDFEQSRSVESAERPILTSDGTNVNVDRRHTRRETCGRRVAGDDSRLPNEEAYTDLGRWNYTQYIKVYDNTAPEIEVMAFGGPTELCPDLAEGQFGDPFGSCDAPVNIMFTVTDPCDALDGTLDYVNLLSAHLDAFAVDANRDGDIKANEFSIDADVLANISYNAAEDKYTFTGTFPIIESSRGDNVIHAIRVVFEDGCGNLTTEYIEFDVVDCKGPAPSCIQGITVTLMPQPAGTDADGDGDEDDCAMATWAVDFEASAIFDCTGQGPEVHPTRPELERVTKYAIYRQSTVDNDPNFEPDPADTGLVLTDDDDETTFVYVYAFDEEGNYDFCSTFVSLDLQNCDGDAMGNLSGVLMTEDERMIQDVEVNLSGYMTQMMRTPVDGYYVFDNLPLGEDYSINPYLNADHVNGVTTFDIVKINKHILGTELLDSPYKMIAADVNNSETITTLDIIQMRKLILNVDVEFANNTSWRFVAADYEFPNPANPWAEDFPEIYNMNNLAGNLTADFIGVKIGDVTNDARANEDEEDGRTMNGTFHLDVDTRGIVWETQNIASLQSGMIYRLPIYWSQ